MARSRRSTGNWTPCAPSSTEGSRRTSDAFSRFRRDSAPRARYARAMNETERQSEERSWETAKTLAEALPY
ncbi:MAG: hypothetical protein DI552_02135, partial [Brevundimonas sp.]